MSIIFEKLKALKNRSSGKDRPSPGLQKEKTTYSIKKLALSPMGAVPIFGTIAGFGLISFYSLSFLKGYLESSSQKAIVVQHQPDEAVPGIPLPGDGLPPGSEPPVGPD
jgi:hypothetical protein